MSFKTWLKRRRTIWHERFVPSLIAGLAVAILTFFFSMTTSNLVLAPNDYSLMNFSLKAAAKLFIFDVALGAGMGSASDYDLTVPSFSGSIKYELPLSGLLNTLSDKTGMAQLSGLKMSLFSDFMMCTSSPLENGTSDLMSLGLGISYPVLF